MEHQARPGIEELRENEPQGAGSDPDRGRGKDPPVQEEQQQARGQQEENCQLGGAGCLLRVEAPGEGIDQVGVDLHAVHGRRVGDGGAVLILHGRRVGADEDDFSGKCFRRDAPVQHIGDGDAVGVPPGLFREGDIEESLRGFRRRIRGDARCAAPPLIDGPGE